MHHRNPWFGNRHALAGQAGRALLIARPLARQKGLVQLVHSNLHAPTRNTGWVPRVGACEGTQAARLAKSEEIRSHSQAGRCLPRWSPSTCGREQQCRPLGFGIISGPLCIAPSRVSSSFQPFAQKYGHLPPPPPSPYMSETALSHIIQKVYTYSPKGTIFWHIGRKVQKLREKCQNPPSWRTMNVPERYILLLL